jgi:methylated-DNA-protein-cysteine methyltransferase-like protein
MPFSSPPDPKAYAAKVYELVRAIPPARVMAYGQIAALILPPPGVDPGQYLKLSPRWVGGAMADCPDDVPWQRVINSQGKVSPRPGYGPLVQRALLEQEGVAFDDKGRVDFEQYGWTPEREWLAEHGFVAPPPDEEQTQPKLF